jgi:hypothetical protein
MGTVWPKSLGCANVAVPEAEGEAMTVVIGAGPDGLRAAAALAVTGESVLLLQGCPTSRGRAVPEVPVDSGRMHVDPGDRGVVEAVLGPLVEAPDQVSGVLVRGRVHRLPLGLRTALQLVERYQMPQVYGRWLERQMRNAAVPLTGEGREERTYVDWVTRRFGEPAMHHLFRAYAGARWGAPAESLSSSVARVAHGMGDGRVGQVVGGGPDAALDHAVEVIERHGGEIRSGVSVSGLRVTQGRVTEIGTDGGPVPVDGPLWIARTPAVVAEWLGDALPTDLQHDAAALRTADSVQVDLMGGPPDLPDVLHALDLDAGFYRIVQTYGGERRRVFHATRAPGTEAADGDLPARFVAATERLGLPGFHVDGARVERLHGHVPIWTPLVHPRLRRLLLAWRALGIVAVGRQGVFTPIGQDTEVRLAARYAGDPDPDQREANRTLVEPPVVSGTLRIGLSDLVIR